MEKVKLYQKINGEIRLVDFGFMECAELYRARGYVVRPAAENDTEPVWKAPVVERPKRTITVCHRPRKTSMWKRISNFINDVVESIIPQPVYA